jgi:hypothetical protein
MCVSICSILNDMVHLCIQVSIPPKLNPFVCEEDSDEDSTCSDSDSNTDSDNSPSEEEDFGSDESYCPGSSASSNTDDGSAMGVDESAMGVDESAMGVDESAMGVDGSAMGVDESAMGVDGSAMGVDGSAIGVDASVQPDEDGQSDEDDLAVLNSRNSRRWCNKWLKTSEGQTTAITRWNHSLSAYHFCTEPPEVTYFNFFPIMRGFDNCLEGFRCQFWS